MKIGIITGEWYWIVYKIYLNYVLISLLSFAYLRSSMDIFELVFHDHSLCAKREYLLSDPSLAMFSHLFILCRSLSSCLLVTVTYLPFSDALFPWRHTGICDHFFLGFSFPVFSHRQHVNILLTFQFHC